MRKLLLVLTALLVVVPALPTVAAAQNVQLKVASLAPKGSAWAKILEAGGKAIDKGTSGRVTVKWYFSGQQGDEKDVVRKMTGGQLDGAAITAVGLSLIVKDVLLLQLPFFFKDDAEVDFVRGQLNATYDQEFLTAGYHLLTWGDVGWVRLYSQTDLQTKADLAKTKMWTWTDDPVMREFFAKLGVNGVPLNVPDVLPGLQTGLIDACYGSPLAAVALQWYTKAKFATATQVSYSIGAFVLTDSAWTSLSAADQAVVVAESQKMGVALMANVRKDNKRAEKAMQKAGIKFTTQPTALQGDLDTAAQKTATALTGKQFSQALLTRATTCRDAFRKKQKTC